MRSRSKTDVIRARCEPDLKQDIERIALFKRLDAADITRIALRDYIQRFKNADTKEAESVR